MTRVRCILSLLILNSIPPGSSPQAGMGSGRWQLLRAELVQLASSKPVPAVEIAQAVNAVPGAAPERGTSGKLALQLASRRTPQSSRERLAKKITDVKLDLEHLKKKERRIAPSASIAQLKAEIAHLQQQDQKSHLGKRFWKKLAQVTTPGTHPGAGTPHCHELRVECKWSTHC